MDERAAQRLRTGGKRVPNQQHNSARRNGRRDNTRLSTYGPATAALACDTPQGLTLARHRSGVACLGGSILAVVMAQVWTVWEKPKLSTHQDSKEVLSHLRACVID